MGCACSKEPQETSLDQNSRPRPSHRPIPLELSEALPPTPPRNYDRKRKPSLSLLESPYRKWQRRQISSVPHPESHASPGVASSRSIHQLADKHPAQAPPEYPTRLPSMPPLGADIEFLSPTAAHQLSLSLRGPAQGPTLPHPADEPAPASPLQGSSLYCSEVGSEEEGGATPPSRLPRSHSYRSLSGRVLYSPVRFPVESSPGGSPTIRKVGSVRERRGAKGIDGGEGGGEGGW